LIASVVLRQMIATSSAPRRANRRIDSLADSNARVAICDLYPAPRCTLEYHGRNSVTRSATAGSALVDAAPSRLR
jgi:hypothetical protein